MISIFLTGHQYMQFVLLHVVKSTVVLIIVDLFGVGSVAK